MLGFAGIVLFGIYFLYLYWLTGGVDVAANGMTSLLGRDKLSLERKVPEKPVPPPVIPPPEPDRITQLQRICAAMAPEVAADKVAVEQTANQIAIRIGNVLLFNSGVATVLDQFKPIGDRIAATLDKEDGYIKVIGHTDNTPIGTSNVRFPSNYAALRLSAPRTWQGCSRRHWPSRIACKPTARARPRRSPTTTPRMAAPRTGASKS